MAIHTTHLARRDAFAETDAVEDTLASADALSFASGVILRAATRANARRVDARRTIALATEEARVAGLNGTRVRRPDEVVDEDRGGEG